MSTVSFKSEVADTFSSVRDFSFEEKKNLLTEEKVNQMLDSILELKRFLNGKAGRVNALVQRIEKVTWYDIELDDESLRAVNDLISVIKDSHSTLIKLYVSLNFLRKKHIAKTEIHNFKMALDDFKDVAQDLESRFFFLPTIPEFEETTRQLSLM